MAKYPKLILKVRDYVTPTKLQQKLLDLIDDDEVRRGVNQIIGNRANKYVPKDSGALRESMKVGPKTISWGSGLDYARYQYGGVVYKFNLPWVEGGKLSGFTTINGRKYPVFDGGTITRWYSPPGSTKTPTNRELGVPGEWRGWKFGYKTPGTKHHWLDEMLSRERRAMQNQITKYLKDEADRRGL